MKTLLTLSFLILITYTSQAQMGTKDYLQEKNGFKTIHLGENISTLKKELLTIYEKKDSTITYRYKDTALYHLSDEITLKDLAVTVYKNRIMNIMLVFDKKEGSKVYLLYYKAFGNFSDQPNRFMDNYYWYSPKVKLALNYESSIGYAYYTSVDLNSEYSIMKSKKEEKAASDL